MTSVIPGVVYRCEVQRPWAVVFVSEGIRGLTGHAPSDFGLGLKLGDIIAPEDVNEVERAVALAVASGEDYDLCYRLVDVRGDRVWVREHGRAFYGADCQPQYLDGIYFDARQPRELAQARDAAEQMRNALMQTLPVPVFVKDADGRYVACNRAFERFAGKAEGEISGRTAPDLWDCPFAAEDHAQDLDLLKHSGQQVAEGLLDCSSGESRSVLVFKSTYGVAGAPPRGIIGCYADVTSEKSARERAEQLAAEKSGFLSTASHEIRTTLGGIVGFSSLLLDLSLGEEQRALAAAIADASESLMQVVSDVLDISRIEAGKLDAHPQDFDLQEMVRQAAGLFARGAGERGLRLTSHVEPPNPPPLHGDCCHIRQILHNLVSNAVKFTDAGCVHVLATLEHTPMRLRFEVRDTGQGIPHEAQAHIFEPFERCNLPGAREKPGTGLGLAICRHLVDRLGGTISLRSSPGQGSAFTFSVPVQAGSPPKRTRPVFVCRPPERGFHVLLADDDPPSRKLGEMVLRRLGCSVTSVADGVACVEEVCRDHFDAVLLDLQMPRMGGIEAARQIRGLRAGSPRLVAVTASSSGVAEEGGFDAVVVKPYRPEELAEALFATVA